MGKVVGIDLGTTNSVVSVLEGGEPVVIPNAEGNRTTPSVVSFTPEGERLVGQIAKRQSILHPERTVASIKRKMGTNHKISIDGKQYTPQEISAMILQKMKETAESYLGEKVTQAIVTVPAYFDDAQRQATKDAGAISGLEVLRIINEPTAAALAYGLDKSNDQTVLVYDLGGGTFDVSILDIGDGVIEVKSTNGNTQLGGDDIDERIMEWMVANYKKEQGIDLSKDKTAMQRLKEAAEKAKIELSGRQETQISLPFITADQNGPRHLDMRLTRAEFEKMNRDLFEMTLGPLKQALADAKMEPKDIDQVLLVGGSTRIPAVQQLIKDQLVKEPNKSVNPDEVVAVGAAIQGGVLAGEVKDVLLLDVTPLSLGIETLGGVFTKLIERNTTIPTRKSEIFTTAADNQTSVEVHVLQGERPMARDNKTLGRFQLTGIPPAPRSIPQIEVTFDIDANGIVNVGAKDIATGKEQQITITGSSNLSKDEINRMVKDAQAHEDEDRKKQEEIGARNQLDSLVFNTEKILSEHGDKVPPDDKGDIERAIEDARKALDSENIDNIKSATERLNKVWNKAAQVMYQQAGASASGGQTPPPGADFGAQDPGSSHADAGKPSGDDNVVDAEFEDISDK